MGLPEILTSTAEAALRLGDQLGVDVVYRHVKSSQYSPSAGTLVTTAVEFTLRAFIYRARSKEIDNTAVLANDQWLITTPERLAPLGTDSPREGDEVRVGNTAYRVVAAHPVVLSRVILWKLQLRGAK